MRQRSVGSRPSRRIDVRSTVAEFSRRVRARVRRRWSRVERSRAPISECAPHVPAFFRAGFSAALVGRVSKFGTVFPRSAVRVNLHRPELANSLKKSVKSECERALGKISKFSRDVEKRVQVFIQLANGLPDIPPRTGEIVAAFARKDIGSGVSEVIARHPTVD